jgi:hypothetical protein
MKHYILLIVFLLSAYAGFTQGWDRVYPTVSPNSPVEVKRILAAPGGGYFAAVQEFTDGANNAYLIKMDDNGQLLWQKPFGYGNFVLPQDMLLTPDGGIAIISNTFNTPGTTPYRLSIFSKFNAQFDLVSEVKTAEFGFFEDSYNILNAQNGNYWVTCVTFNQTKGYLKLVNDQGVKQGLITTGLTNLRPIKTISAANGDLIVFCNGQLTPNGFDQIGMNRYDATGNFIDQKIYGDPTIYSTVRDAIATPDGGWMIAGTENTATTQNEFILKLDNQGNVVFKKTYDIATDFSQIRRVQLDPTGNGYRLLVDDSYPINYDKSKLIYLDNAGNIVKSITFSDVVYTKGNDFFTLPDNGNIVAGKREKGLNEPNMTTTPIIPWITRRNAEGVFANSGVSGQLRYDENNDCISDKDTLTASLSVYVFQDSIVMGSALTDATGNYYIPLAPGNYKVFTKLPNVLWTTCLDTIAVTVLANDTTSNNNFAIQYNNFPVDSMSGYVFKDYDFDCVKDSFETTVYAGWAVVFSMQEGNNSYAETRITDANGYYSFTNFTGFTNAAQRFIYFIPPAGTLLQCDYACAQETMLPLEQFSPNMQYSLGVQCDTLMACAEMHTSIGIPWLRPCIYSDYTVQVRNDGTATANDASVVVTIDSTLEVWGSSIPWVAQTDNVYTFNIGDLPPHQSFVFTIQVFLPCGLPPGTTYCSSAYAYPDSLCNANKDAWDGSKIEIMAECVGDSVIFTITNTGLGNMEQPLEYIVIEDNVLLMMPGNFQLNAGSSTTVTVPADGSFLRLEAKQAPGYPGQGTPVAWAEGCGSGGQTSLGFVNAYPLGDEDPWYDVNCTESVNSFDPNDKRGFPTGINAEHFINQNVDLEYVIRFQNTGTATAFRVEVRDTIPVQFLDPTTVRAGASSHTYNWDMQGNGVVVFTFPNINLPDSNANLIESQGYVQFTVQQRKNLPIGTVIRNDAAIYFDDNTPVITNETFHTIGKDFLTSATPVPGQPLLQVEIMPNPMHEQAQVRIIGELTQNGSQLFNLIDMTGRQVLSQSFTGSSLEIGTTGLPSGIYFYEIRNKNAVIGRGKLVKR